MSGIVVLLDENKVKIAEKPIIEMDFKEECIIEESIRLFRDRDPCIIHRTFCANKIGMALLDELNRKYRGQKELCFEIKDLPESMLSKINFPPVTKYVIIR